MIRVYCQHCGERVGSFNQSELEEIPRGRTTCSFICEDCCNTFHAKCRYSCELCEKSTEVTRGILKGLYCTYRTGDNITIVPIDSSISIIDDDPTEEIEIEWEDEMEEPDLFEEEDWERC